MQYEPIKRSLGKVFTKSVFLRKIFYALLDLLLLRTWHVKKAIKETAPTLPVNASVLDAGSGFGQYTWRISCLHKDWKIKAVDINKEQVEDCNNFIVATGRSERVRFETVDLTLLKETDNYDFVLTVDVMEHIEKDELVFSNFYKSLKHNGILMISTPSDQGGSDVHDNEDHSFIEEHVRDGYGIEEITQKLKSAGFRSVNVRYTYGRAGTISWIISMKYPVKMINKSYLFFVLLPFYYLLTFPVSFLLNIIDLSSTIKKGTGLLVTARK
ncbi:MAG: methyltransferase type 11 [Odoribacter sp.]|nr:methyltransferase type 11 [Odoribacter sp.]